MKLIFKNQKITRYGLIVTAFCLLNNLLLAQETAEDEDEVFELSPFAVEVSENQGYMATSTLAGTRVPFTFKNSPD